MLKPARQAAILKAVTARGSCGVAELAQALDVSGETIRRDIKAMAEDGLVRKVHGGVRRPDLLRESDFHQRLGENAEAKRAIARRAAREVRDGDSLMLDTGSTTAYVAQALRDHRDLMVATNSVDIARTLATRNGNRVYMAGGELRADDGAALGPAATTFIQQFRVRLAFLSIAAIDAEEGLMDYHLSEAEFSRVVMDRAERTIIVADRSKFGSRALVRVAGFTAVDLLITDAAPPEPFAELLREAGVGVATTEDGGATE
ncbi:MAG: DeoR/GlpR family DNA-binding transcription regulator [Alphaproteobacteria bacterium]